MRHTAPVPLHLIHMDRWPFRRVLSICDHLQRGGSVPPIHVALRGDGSFRILDGRHRMHAFKLLERTHILARWGEPLFIKIF